MARPSDPLLELLRRLVQERGGNTAQVANRAGIPRARLRKVLTGGDPMTVDELLMLSQALDLSPADMGLPADLPDVELPAAPLSPVSEEDPLAGVDPFGNQPRQLLEIGFRLGCDFGFLADVSLLANSGIPQQVLRQYQGSLLRIQLDAAYHQYNEPKFEDEMFSLVLSFDALYTCTFPYGAVRQVLFSPAAPEPPAEEDPAPRSSGPHLRLVT